MQAPGPPIFRPRGKGLRLPRTRRSFPIDGLPASACRAVTCITSVLAFAVVAAEAECLAERDPGKPCHRAIGRIRIGRGTPTHENKTALVVGFVVGLSPRFVGADPVLFRFFTNRSPRRGSRTITQPIEIQLTFYDFPAEHWKHLRTTNPIESTFATVRHRTIRSKGCLSNRTALGMVFKLVEDAQKSWRRLDGNNQLPKLILGVKFADGARGRRQAGQPSARNHRRLIDQAVKNWR
jgi:hypothetical protein